MGFALRKTSFELFLRPGEDDHDRPSFTPIAHDILVLNRDGALGIKKNAPAGLMSEVLLHSNHIYEGICNDDKDMGALILIRFEGSEEDENDREASPQSDNDWSRVWPRFDCCSGDDAGALDFVTRLRQTDTHCHSSVSNKKTHGVHALECRKISYSFNCSDKHILLAHHLHKINDESKEMVRMMTYGLSLGKIKAVFSKVLPLLTMRSPSGRGSGSLGGFASPPIPVPHPKLIVCCMLECLEERCRKDLKIDKEYIVGIEDDIQDQRNCESRKLNRLGIICVELGETRIRLGDVGGSLENLRSSITSLEETEGLPRACESCASTCEKQGAGNGTGNVGSANEDQLSPQWGWQLQAAETRLSRLKVKCQQHRTDIENLQERVKGILSIVSILLAEKKNEYSRKLNDSRDQRSKYRVRLLKYQVDMLAQQRVIAAGAKSDNTVMKVVALLTALFLPGTFIATLFSVPIFTWNQDSIIGRHFMIYWYYTAPITTVLVAGFSVWFAKMWWDDRRGEMEERDGEGDPEEGKIVGK